MMRARNGHGLHTSPVLYLEALARCLSEKNLNTLICNPVAQILFFRLLLTRWFSHKWSMVVPFKNVDIDEYMV
jgi:hypothetical protein